MDAQRARCTEGFRAPVLSGVVGWVESTCAIWGFGGPAPAGPAAVLQVELRVRLRTHAPVRRHCTQVAEQAPYSVRQLAAGSPELASELFLAAIKRQQGG